eukprot:8110413-Alexandrium_andersonii.AAC.1
MVASSYQAADGLAGADRSWLCRRRCPWTQCGGRPRLLAHVLRAGARCRGRGARGLLLGCLLYTSDAADDM